MGNMAIAAGMPNWCVKNLDGGSTEGAGKGAIEGVALRYGFFYGPNTWYRPGGSPGNMAMRQEIPVVGAG